MISGLNHITLAVSNLETSLAFYIEVLGLQGRVKWTKGCVPLCWRLMVVLVL